MIYQACKAILGSDLDSNDVDAIKSAIRFLGYTPEQLVSAMKNAKVFFDNNGYRIDRKGNDRLKPSNIFKRMAHIEMYLNNKTRIYYGY